LHQLEHWRRPAGLGHQGQVGHERIGDIGGILQIRRQQAPRLERFKATLPVLSRGLEKLLASTRDPTSIPRPTPPAKERTHRQIPANAKEKFRGAKAAQPKEISTELPANLARPEQPKSGDYEEKKLQKEEANMD
jgi:hypothetical protein